MRNRIVLLVVSMMTLVVLAFAIPLAVLIRHKVYDDATRSVQLEVRDIAYTVQESPVADSAITAYLRTLRDDRSASVLTPSGSVLGTAPPGGAPPVPSGPDEHPGGPDSDGDHRNGGGGPQEQSLPWHGGQLMQLAVPTRQGLYVVRLWASDDELHSGETPWWVLLGGTSAGLLALGVVASVLLTRRIVRPLVHTAATARQLAAGDVTARAPTSGPPEVAEVGVALNRLADRIDELIAEERETVANLSHRLRTPLTALRLDAETLRDPAEAERIGDHASKLERMLTAVIRAARRPQREGRLPACDATAVLRDRLQFWSALTEEQGRASAVTLPAEPVSVRCAADDLAAAVDALLENVVAHTPEGTPFAVTLVGSDHGAEVTVSDEGPGLRADALERGRSDRGSTGLGLDIARRCAEASGGSLSLGAGPAGGACVTLHLGRA